MPKLLEPMNVGKEAKERLDATEMTNENPNQTLDLV